MNQLSPILYAEDDENDVFLMERALEKLSIPNPLRIASDGRQAMAYLAGQEPFANRDEHPLPCLVLLDLSMPGRHGLDVLQWMKSQPTLASVPVVILSSSNQESDIHRAYLLRAEGYLIKPGDPDELIRIMKSIQQYWLGETRPARAFVDSTPAGLVHPPRSLPK